MKEIPVQTAPNQAFSVIIDDISVSIRLQTTQTGLYANVAAEGTPIVTGRKCQDRTNLLVGESYRGYAGLQLYFVDLQGTSDPVWSELGTRYILLTGAPTNVEGTALTDVEIIGSSQTLPNGQVVLTYSGIAQYNGTYNFQ